MNRWLLLVGTLFIGCVERGEVLTPLERSEAVSDDTSPESDEPTSGDPTDDPTAPTASDASSPSDTPEVPSSDAAPMPSAPSPTNDAYDLSAGWSHSCAVSQGLAFCWGANSSGQLGLGDAASRTSPTRVNADAPFRSITAGRRHTCASSESGEILCWGANDRGQLGQGDRQSRSSPVAVSLPAPAVSISSNFEHACALLEDARLFCWGKNDEGQLGQADAYPASDDRAADALRPLEVSDGDFSHVDTGDGHTCATRTDGSLWCFGRNSFGELGNDRAVQIRVPTRVGTGSNWASSATGQNHTCALERNGALWCWGHNNGLPTNDGAPLGLEGVEVSRAPVRVGERTGWSGLRTDTFHTCALDVNALYCWGRNVEGQLGTGDLELRTEPTLIGSGYSKVRVGRFHTCASTTELGIQCTGRNDEGELGTGDTRRRRTLVDVELSEE